MTKIIAKLLLVLCVSMPLPGQTPSTGTQEQKKDDVRGIVPEQFVKARPKKGGRAASNRTQYKAVSPAVPADAEPLQPPSSQYAQIGVTIWRLRGALPADRGARIVDRSANGVTEWTPLRVEASTPIGVGERLRLSIESSVQGYLYVINRELYRDGTLGRALLVFPTTRARGGDNLVRPGRLIEIPAQEDEPSYFYLNSVTRRDHTGELLTIVVARQPIEGLVIGSTPITLDKDVVAKWEKTWGGRVEQFELAGGSGKAWTQAEQAAGADETRELTQGDPPPQTIFRVPHGPNAPVLVNVGLRIRTATRQEQQ